MVGVFRFGPILPAMKETGAMIKPMERASSFMLTATYTMVNGGMTRLKAREPILTLMVPITKASGWMISSMAEVLRAGLMVLGTKAIMKTERRKDLANLLLRMAPSTKDNSERMRSLERAGTSGLTARLTMASGKRTKCMDTVLSSGRTARLMKVASLMISAKVKALSYGLTADDTSEDGELASRTVKAPTLTRRMRPAEVSGRTDAKSNGLTGALAVMIK